MTKTFDFDNIVNIFRWRVFIINMLEEIKAVQNELKTQLAWKRFIGPRTRCQKQKYEKTLQPFSTEVLKLAMLSYPTLADNSPKSVAVNVLTDGSHLSQIQDCYSS